MELIDPLNRITEPEIGALPAPTAAAPTPADMARYNWTAIQVAVAIQTAAAFFLGRTGWDGLFFAILTLPVSALIAVAVVVYPYFQSHKPAQAGLVRQVFLTLILVLWGLSTIALFDRFRPRLILTSAYSLFHGKRETADAVDRICWRLKPSSKEGQACRAMKKTGPEWSGEAVQELLVCAALMALLQMGVPLALYLSSIGGDAVAIEWAQRMPPPIGVPALPPNGNADNPTLPSDFDLWIKDCVTIDPAAKDLPSAELWKSFVEWSKNMQWDAPPMSKRDFEQEVKARWGAHFHHNGAKGGSVYDTIVLR